MIAVLMASPHARASAQGVPPAKECTRLAAVLASAASAADSSGPAWYSAVHCPNGGQYIASVMTGKRTSADTIIAERIMDAARLLQDGRIVTAGISVVNGSGNATNARVASLMALALQWQTGMGLPSATLYGSGPIDTTCVLLNGGTGELIAGQPVPSTIGHTLLSTSANLLASTTAPTALRRVAACVFRTATILERPAVATAKLSLSYKCGNTFILRNRNYVRARVAYITTELADTTQYWLDAASPLAPNRDHLIHTWKPSSVTLLYGGTALQTVANGGRPC